MWQFSETVRGLADACLELGLPITGGNVSFYNQTGAVAILPTPIIGVLGVIQDVRSRTPMGFTRAGMDIYLLGREEITLAGSEWAYLHNQRGGVAPKAELAHEARLVEVLLAGQGLFESAHDLSMGGLAASIVEAILKNRIGATIELSSISEELFSETPGRVLVAVDPRNAGALIKLSEPNSVNCKKIGVTGGSELNVNNVVKISIADLSKSHTEVFPKLFGNSETANRLSA